MQPRPTRCPEARGGRPEQHPVAVRPRGAAVGPGLVAGFESPSPRAAEPRRADGGHRPVTLRQVLRSGVMPFLDEIRKNCEGARSGRLPSGAYSFRKQAIRGSFIHWASQP